MSLYAPSYYPHFTCIADTCRHSCCIGWEIDIDPATLARYRALPPKERKKILAHTVTQKGTTFFRLAAGDRCPFLTEKGLCQLILTHGEDILCEICREHPRFYNQFTYRTEVGLGLCCEEAARLILTSDQPFDLIRLEESTAQEIVDPFEADFFSTRKEIFNILTNRNLPLRDRIDEIIHRFSLNRDLIFHNDSHWQTIYRNLERLDPAWDDALDAWENMTVTETLPDSVMTEQLIAYFFYRHLPDALFDNRLAERIAFGLLSAHIICSIATIRQDEDPISVLIDVARAYSAEIEYDTDNLQFILDNLESNFNSSK